MKRDNNYIYIGEIYYFHIVNKWKQIISLYI